MNSSNHLLSSDNKGYASLLFEKKMEPNSLFGKTKFVCAFAQSNEGDVSPNILGPRCIDTGLPCDAATSSCNGENKLCVAFGPGKDQFESTKIIAERQFNKAWELFNTAKEKVSGPLKFVSQQADMSNFSININSTTKVTTCKPAFGFSFGAGTTDGPGIPGLLQHTPVGRENFLWYLLVNLLFPPSDDLKHCHRPKPVLIPTGELNYPSPWQPTILTLQILQIGQLAIVAVPAEFTTMAGRRTRNAVRNILEEGRKDLQVVIAGLANGYSSYVATYEEYQFQRYEGASTIYGPHTLSAYIQLLSNLAEKLLSGGEVSPGPAIPDFSKSLPSLSFSPLFDWKPPNRNYGDILVDANKAYQKGSIVDVVFVCGHPRNNIMWEDTYIKVEILENGREWKTIATDTDWETRFIWESCAYLYGRSNCRIQWEIPNSTVSGVYRIRHFGHQKSLFQYSDAYEGSTTSFNVE